MASAGQGRGCGRGAELKSVLSMVVGTGGFLTCERRDTDWGGCNGLVCEVYCPGCKYTSTYCQEHGGERIARAWVSAHRLETGH